VGSHPVHCKQLALFQTFAYTAKLEGFKISPTE